jgi:hypothetical protein
VWCPTRNLMHARLVMPVQTGIQSSAYWMPAPDSSIPGQALRAGMTALLCQLFTGRRWRLVPYT